MWLETTGGTYKNYFNGMGTYYADSGSPSFMNKASFAGFVGNDEVCECVWLLNVELHA